MFDHQKNLYLCASMLLLAGCADYSASSLSALSSGSAVQSANDSSVTAAWKIYDKKDCQTYLGRDLIAEGYVPMQLTIRNNSEDSLYLSQDNFNIDLPSCSQVAKTVHTSTIGRVALWGLGGLLLTPLFIPAIYDGVRSSKANRSLDTDYESKTLKEHTIEPHTMFDTIVFVTKDQIKKNIEMFLMNERTQEKIVFPILKNGYVCLQAPNMKSS